MWEKDLNFPFIPRVCWGVFCVLLSTSANAEHPESLAKTPNSVLEQVLERINCSLDKEDCEPIHNPPQDVDKLTILNGLAAAFSAQHYLKKHELRSAYLALLQIPSSWWRLERFKAMEAQILDELGLRPNRRQGRLFSGAIWRYLGEWFGRIGEHFTASKPWIVAELAWSKRDESLEEIFVLVRDDLEKQDLQQSVKGSLARREPELALTQLATMNGRAERPCWWWYLKTKALRNLRKWGEAQNVLNQGVGQCKTHEPSHPWLLLLGTRIHTVRGNRRGAFRLASILERTYPNHRLNDDAVYRLIRLHLTEANGLRAAYDLAMKQVDRDIVGDRIDDGIFQVVLALLKKSRWKDAEGLLRKSCSKPHWKESDGEEGRCWYWLTRVQEIQGADVSAAYAQLFQLYPFSWYGLLGAQRAKLNLVDMSSVRTPYRAAVMTELEDIKGALEALPPGQTSRTDEFRQYAMSLVEDIRLAEHQKTDCAKLRADTCIYLAESIQSLRSQEPLDKSRLAYIAPYFPRAHRKIVRWQSQRQKVPKSLIWAIIREESRFDPRAVSFVGARGLMQLMPATAGDMARVEGIKKPRLFSPATNIRLGTRYLKFVKAYVKNSWVVVPPGYNAGQGALRKWLRANASTEFDLFVETIPYDEARSYTKKVNRSFAIYQLLANENPFSILGTIDALTDPR